MSEKSCRPDWRGSGGWWGLGPCLILSMLVSCAGWPPERGVPVPDCPRFGDNVADQLLELRLSQGNPELKRWIEDLLIYCFVEEIEFDE